MDQNKFNRLLEIAESSETIKLRVLRNAVIECLKTYQKESTSAHLTDWQRAESALEAFVAELAGKHLNEGQAKTLPNIPAVVAYLSARGWKVGKDSAYKHRKEGKLRAQQDGSFILSDVDRYAESYLKRKDGTESKPIDQLQQERLLAEVDKMKAQARHWNVRADTISGAYVPKDLFERELAKRVAVFRNDLETFARAEAASIVSVVAGDVGKIPDLINYLLGRFEGFLARYAEERHFKVPLPPPEDETDEDTENEEPVSPG